VALKPDGKSARTERVSFTRPAAERIAQVVRKVEAGDRNSKGLTFPRPVNVGGGGGGGGTPVRLAVYTATAAWFPFSPVFQLGGITTGTSTATVKTIQFVFPTQTATIDGIERTVAGGETALCVNNMAFLPTFTTVVTAATRVVIVARENDWWRLIGAQ
jgi:hypothetical protein